MKARMRATCSWVNVCPEPILPLKNMIGPKHGPETCVNRVFRDLASSRPAPQPHGSCVEKGTGVEKAGLMER